MALGPANERAAAAAWMQTAVAEGLDTRCGFSDALDKGKARETFEAMVGMGVEEVGCGRPDWIREVIAEH